MYDRFICCRMVSVSDRSLLVDKAVVAAVSVIADRTKNSDQGINHHSGKDSDWISWSKRFSLQDMLGTNPTYKNETLHFNVSLNLAKGKTRNRKNKLRIQGAFHNITSYSIFGQLDSNCKDELNKQTEYELTDDEMKDSGRLISLIEKEYDRVIDFVRNMWVSLNNRKLERDIEMIDLPQKLTDIFEEKGITVEVKVENTTNCAEVKVHLAEDMGSLIMKVNDTSKWSYYYCSGIFNVIIDVFDIHSSTELVTEKIENLFRKLAETVKYLVDMVKIVKADRENLGIVCTDDD